MKRKFSNRINRAQKSVDNTFTPWLKKKHAVMKKRFFGGK